MTSPHPDRPDALGHRARWRVVIVRALALVVATTLLGVAAPTAATGSVVAAPAGAVRPCGADAGGVAAPGLTAHLPGATNHEAMLLRLIVNARRSSTIRVAMWTFTNTALSSALTRAAAGCDVHVQVLVPRIFAKPDGQTTAFPFPATSNLQRALNNDDDPRSYVKVVSHSARGRDSVGGEGTTMHQKSWQFSASGTSRNVTIITSANATNEARTLQATDAYTWVGGNTTGDKVFTNVWNMFDRQKRDRVEATPYAAPRVGDAQLFWGPWNPGMADPVVARINALPDTRDMTIRIANASWYGGHGEKIANALVAKVKAARRNDRHVAVFVIADMGGPVRAKLNQINPGYCPSSGSRGYLHSKFMSVKTADAGRAPTYEVWSGSANWNPGAVTADELGFRVPGVAAYSAYQRYFDAIRKTFLIKRSDREVVCTFPRQ